MSEIDSTSYFFAYVIVFFLCPWCIYAFYLIRELHFLVKKNKNSFLILMGTALYQINKNNSLINQSKEINESR